MHRVRLVRVKSGKKVKVVEIIGGRGIQDKLFHMGVYPQREIIKLSQFALRGPVAVKTGRSVIALGHGMANKILVDVLE